MKAENAKLGIGKIYRAEILTIIATIISIAGIVVMIVFGKVVSSKGDTVNNTDVISLIVILVSLVLAIIAFVLNLRGIFLASKDEPAFKDALVAVILGLLTSILAGVFSKNRPSLSNAFESANNIAELFTAYYIIRGCINLAQQKKDEKIVKSGNTAMTLVFIVWIAAAILKIVPTFIPADSRTAVEGILSIASLVLAIIAYIIYLKVLRKTSDIL